jgi:two-component system chemotaxis sensor kinase CheA
LEGGGYDVVVCDLEMPVMDGFEFARAVRQRPCHRDLPLLAVSGAGEQMRTPALDAGFDEFRSKFDRPRFLEAFQRLCQRTGSAQCRR